MKRKTNEIIFRVLFPSESRISSCWKNIVSHNGVLFEELDAIRKLRNFKSSLELVNSYAFQNTSLSECVMGHMILISSLKNWPHGTFLHVKLNHSSVSKETLRHYTEPQGSLPCSEALTNCRHPEPDKPSPNILTAYLKIYFNIILHSTLMSSMSLSLFHKNPVPVYLKINSNCFPSSSPGLTNMRTSITWIVSVVKFNEHNIIGQQNIIWQLY